ncbi:hypothetical protein C0Q70_02912 [Pomacea canaliculata]|uniref:Uncharacterized protein n=1 Tax=Pomacea canaliculata TaxID=400727 RepID=A0A2T7PR90_POMCA|nr:hypothetical protein C0Q70_02912 [Pomacea canaliculata]
MPRNFRRRRVLPMDLFPLRGSPAGWVCRHPLPCPRAGLGGDTMAEYVVMVFWLLLFTAGIFLLRIDRCKDTTVVKTVCCHEPLFTTGVDKSQQPVVLVRAPLHSCQQAFLLVSTGIRKKSVFQRSMVCKFALDESFLFVDLWRAIFFRLKYLITSGGLSWQRWRETCRRHPVRVYLLGRLVRNGWSCPAEEVGIRLDNQEDFPRSHSASSCRLWAARILLVPTKLTPCWKSSRTLHQSRQASYRGERSSRAI